MDQAGLLAWAAMVDGNTSRVGLAFVVVGLAITAAHGVQEVRTSAANRRADPHEVAAATALGQLAELGGVFAVDPREAAAGLTAPAQIIGFRAG
jgi:hypothetical protein